MLLSVELPVELLPAARLRRLDETAEIVLFEKGEYISYANCGLPYYIGGVIEERERLFVQTPESFLCPFPGGSESQVGK